MRVPSLAATSDAIRTVTCPPAAAVTTLLMNVTYAVFGEISRVAGAASFSGRTTTSTALSLIMIGEMTKPVPPSRSPSAYRLASTTTRPSIRLMPCDST